MFDGGTFFRVITGLSVACSLGLAGPVEQAAAGEVKFFRIATGSTGGTYFPIGSIIASAISNPPGSRACADGGSCGIPGLIAVAQTTRGSVENIELITAGKVESGLCQADVAHQTYFGKGLLAGNAAYQKLRVVASLYPELVHVAVRKHRGIFKIEDLRGKRVSLGAQGSGTAVDAANILAAFGLGEGDYQAFHLAPGESSDRLQAGEIDAFFVVGGTPFPALRDLTEVAEIDLLPIEGARAKALVDDYPFFATAELPAGLYRHVPPVKTLSVSAQWLVADSMDEKLVYQLTKALWQDATRRLLEGGHPVGRLIRLENALIGIAIPLHEGAQRYYREVGALH